MPVVSGQAGFPNPLKLLSEPLPSALLTEPSGASWLWASPHLSLVSELGHLATGL